MTFVPPLPAYRELAGLSQRHRSVPWPLDGWNIAWVMAREEAVAAQARIAGWRQYADYFTLDTLLQVTQSGCCCTWHCQVEMQEDMC